MKKLLTNHDDIGGINLPIDTCYNFFLKDLIDDVRLAYKNGYIGEHNDRFQHFIDKIYTRDFSSLLLIDDAIADTKWWACFKQNEEKKPERHLKLVPKTSSSKVGRNDPCPCGSGKKHKKCCLMKSEEDLVNEYRNNILAKYPKNDETRENNLFRDFSEKAITLDQEIYVGMENLWENGQKYKTIKNDVKFAHLLKAYEMWCEIFINENIKSFEEFDERYMVHYFSKDWILQVATILVENGLELTNFPLPIEYVLKTFSSKPNENETNDENQVSEINSSSITIEEAEKEQEKYLRGFESSLIEKKLSEKTIKKHVKNAGFYLYFLNYYEPCAVRDGIYQVDMFLGDWFLRKCAFSTPASVKEFATSIKKFYTNFMKPPI